MFTPEAMAIGSVIALAIYYGVLMIVAILDSRRKKPMVGKSVRRK